MPTSSRINLFRELTSVFIILAFMLAFAMRPSDRRRFAVLIASLAVLNILLFAAQLRLRSDSEPNDVDAREQSELQPQQERGEPVQARSTAASVTLLLRDFEEWSHQLSAVAAAVERHSLQLRIVADRLPYPPALAKDMESTQVVALDPEPNLPAVERQNIIASPWTLVVPDGAILVDPQIVEEAIAQSPAERQLYFAPLHASPEACSQAKLDLQRWTLSVDADSLDCNFVEGPAVVLLPTKVLALFAWDKYRPLIQGVFLQALALGIKTRQLPQLARSFQLLEHTIIFPTAHLQEKHRRVQAERVQLLYQYMGVKKVVRPDYVEWRGCSRNTARCFGTVVNDKPDYLYRGRLQAEGRWTPPCCQEHIRETIRYAVERLSVCGARYWLEGGTLLGAMRNNDLIPSFAMLSLHEKWDYDADIGIWQDDVAKCEELARAAAQGRHVSKEGFVWEQAVEGGFFRVQYSQVNHIHVDIFPFYEKNGVMTKDTWMPTHPQDREFPVHFLQPLERMTFVGVSVSVPNNARRFLELKFGAGAIENPRLPGV